jgi:hypothetical protein
MPVADQQDRAAHSPGHGALAHAGGAARHAVGNIQPVCGFAQAAQAVGDNRNRAHAVPGENAPDGVIQTVADHGEADILGHAALRKIHETIRKQSFDGMFFIDNAIRENGRVVPQKSNRTETCQYYAFFLGTATPETHPALLKILLNDFGPKRKTTNAYADIYPSNAFIGNYLRLEMLSRYGHVKQLLNESIDEFLYMANLTGTLWENITTRGSLNHGFASHIAHVFYRDMLGLHRIDPLNRQLDIVFFDTDVKICQGTVPAGDQLISMKWEKKGRKLHYTLSTPEGYQVNVKNHTGLTLEENIENK